MSGKTAENYYKKIEALKGIPATEVHPAMEYITTALGVQPWGDYYGKLTDRFGVQWMLNCSSKT